MLNYQLLQHISKHILFSLIIASSASTFAAPGDLFEDVTQSAGIDHAAQTFGISWGDMNGDGWPDAYVSNHWRTPSLYINQQDGTFLEVAAQHDLDLGNRDVHGALWADFDNDGDQDLLAAPGGTNGILPFYINANERLTILDPLQTGLDWIHSDRMPLWFDQDNDGDLDVIITCVGKTEASAFYSQVGPGIFQNRTAEVGFADIIGSGSRLIRSNNTALPYVLLDNGRAFNIGGNTWSEITDEIFTVKRGAGDYLYGDVDSDGCMDLYTIKRGVLYQLRQSDSDRRLELSTRSWINDLSGLNFQGNSTLSFVTGLSLGYESFRLGANSALINPQDHDLPIVIDANDPRLTGEPVIQLEDSALLYLWKDQNQWYLRYGSSARRRLIEFTIDSVEPISNLQTVNVDLEYYPHSNKFKKGDCSGNYTEVASDINVVGPSMSGVLADFDNDMDLDLYLTNNNPLDNPPNQYFENNGDGSFTEISGASGAAGSTLGNGGYVSTADYDMDGFLDLFVLNGKTDFVAAGQYLGPHQLFRNVGNENNWIEIDLEGTYSNRDAIGAFVELYAGGVRQIRYQDGGAHTFSQNFDRLHFGLAQNEKVDKIIVTWPSGQKSTVINIRGNQLVRIREDEQEFVKGESAQYLQSEPGIHLWKDSYDGPFKLRVVENGMSSNVKVTMLSTTAPENIAGVSLETDDLLDIFPYGFQLNSNEDLGEDGVDFTLTPGGKAIVSILVDGKESLYRLGLGNNAYSPLPEAWVVDLNSVTTRPAFDSNTEIGSFVGKSVGGDILEYRWSGAGKLHMNTISLISSNQIQSAQGVNINTDKIESGANWVEVSTGVRRGWDGLDVAVEPNSKIAFSVLQDGLFTQESVNNGYPRIDKPNAFWMPYPDFKGSAPVYDPWQEAGMFIWKDSNEVWHLRTMAGGTYSKFKGTIVTEAPVEYITELNIESSDKIELTDSNTITFDTQVARGWYDGIDFKLTDSGSITIQDTLNSGSGSEFPVFIGTQKWPVVNLPVELVDQLEFPRWYGPR